MSLAAAQIEIVHYPEDIAARVAALADEIAASCGDDLLVIAILKGSFVFAADLLRALHRAGIAPEVDFIFLASYGTGVASSGEIKLLRDIESEVAGRDVLIVDDILDSGRTLAFAKARFLDRNASRVLTCVLVDKQTRRAVEVEADFRGFACREGEFVVGYGMDLAHRYRELPFIGRPIAGSSQ